MNMENSIVIVSAARTPMGGFQGDFATVTSPELGAAAIKEAVNRAGIEPSEVDEVIMGIILSSGVGQSPARQAMRKAGFKVGILAILALAGCSSVSITTSPLRVLIVTGTISSLKCPC